VAFKLKQHNIMPILHQAIKPQGQAPSNIFGTSASLHLSSPSHKREDDRGPQAIMLIVASAQAKRTVSELAKQEACIMGAEIVGEIRSCCYIVLCLHSGQLALEVWNTCFNPKKHFSSM
jgi:hypothetical protein